MARCPYLDYDDRGPWDSQGDYVCKLSGKTLSKSEVDGKCKPDYGDNYEDCSTYKNR